MAEKKKTRVVIVSEQPIFMRGLRSMILAMEGFQLVGEAARAGDAAQLWQLSQPEMLILDLKSDLPRWREVLQAALADLPGMTLVLLLEAETQAQEECLALTTYCISRDVSEEELRAALAQIQERTAQSGKGPSRFEAAPLAADDLPEEARRLGQPPFQPRNEAILERELVMAGRIQADILPEEPPVFPGWEVAAALAPANETSGDFYDFIPLSDRKWGLVVADVTDKGMGAALFMALSSTLIRTYAVRFPTLPALTLNAVSTRLLNDTRGSMFVTAFYGILEPHNGRLVFANAGHPAGVLIGARKGKLSIDQLRPTGMALGVSEEARWKQKEVRINPGDVLVLYTDGMTEAQNAQGEFYGDVHLMDTALEAYGGTAGDILEGLLADIQRFSLHAPRQDDIALVVIRRLE